MHNNRKRAASFRRAIAEVDWLSANTHVFFVVQVVGIIWLSVLLLSRVFSWQPLASSHVWTITLMIIARYYIGMWFVTVWRHRFFSHNSFKVSEGFKWTIPIIAFICSADAQRGICQWAAEHVWHHKHSDTEKDLHSCRRGLAWCHMLWVVKKGEPAINWELIPHLNKMRVVKWIENRQWIGILVGGGTFSLIGSLVHVGGFDSFWANFVFSLCAYFCATTLLWHGTFLINSAMHMVGKQKYDTGDGSKNSLICAILTLGEGWHNNHHYDFRSLQAAKRLAGGARRKSSELYWQGHTWFEKCFDWSGVSIWLLIKLRVFEARA